MLRSRLVSCVKCAGALRRCVLVERRRAQLSSSRVRDSTGADEGERPFLEDFNEEPLKSFEQQQQHRRAASSSNPYFTVELRELFLGHDYGSGSPSRVPSRSFSAEMDARIVELIRRGARLSHIAQCVGKSAHAVRLRIQEALDPRLTHGPFTDREDALVRAVGLSGADLSRGFERLACGLKYTRSPRALLERWKQLRVVEGASASTVASNSKSVSPDAAVSGDSNDPVSTRANAVNSNDASAQQLRARWTAEEDAMLLAAVERHGRRWESVRAAMEGHTLRDSSTYSKRYTRLLRPWMRVPYLLDIRRELLSLLREASGSVEEAIDERFVGETALSARHWVAVEFGMDDASQVNWVVVNAATQMERYKAVSAVAWDLADRLTREEWREGATAVLIPPGKAYTRPVFVGRERPIRAVATHADICRFVRDDTSVSKEGGRRDAVL